MKPMPQRSPQAQALIAQGFLQVDEKKRTYQLGAPIGLWLVDRATRDALSACMRAAHGEMLSLGYQWLAK